MTEQQVREIVRDELSKEEPFRGGWFTGKIHGVRIRRWRDPQTGNVFLDDSMKTGKTLFEDYTNVQWEDVAPVRQEWPPDGLVVLVKWDESGHWWYSESNGRGEFRLAPNDPWEEAYEWKYIPANWDNAPEECTQWVVTSTGEQDWVSRRYKVGEQYYDGCTILHVEDRP